MIFESTEDFFYKINLWFSWVLAAPLVLFVILYLEWRDDSWMAFIQSETLLRIAIFSGIPIILGIGIFAHLTFRKSIREIEPSLVLRDKLGKYAALFLRMQLFFTISALISMLSLFLTGSNLFAVYYLILLFFISLSRPSPQLISKQLKLSSENREILLKKKPLQNED